MSAPHPNFQRLVRYLAQVGREWTRQGAPEADFPYRALPVPVCPRCGALVVEYGGSMALPLTAHARARCARGHELGPRQLWIGAFPDSPRAARALEAPAPKPEPQEVTPRVALEARALAHYPQFAPQLHLLLTAHRLVGRGTLTLTLRGAGGRVEVQATTRPARVRYTAWANGLDEGGWLELLREALAHARWAYRSATGRWPDRAATQRLAAWLHAQPPALRPPRRLEATELSLRGFTLLEAHHRLARTARALEGRARRLERLAHALADRALRTVEVS